MHPRTILNLMLGPKRGGLEQAALDYAESLRLAQISALTVITPGAWIEAPLVAAGVPHESLANHLAFDFLAPRRLRALAARVHAGAIICHGNRALKLALRSFPSPQQRPAIIAVAHNYLTQRFAQADGCFAITQHLRDHLAAAGVAHIHAMPNMVRLPAPAPRPAFRQPPVIGSMGRFVPKKGFEVYLDALAILKNRGIPFHAVLGGDGEEADFLKQRIAQHGLQAQVSLSGWVQDKTVFYESIDVFVLPSHHEPFGIVLIEAMAHAVPTVTTDAEGPREIVDSGVDALRVPKRDALAMADAIARLLAEPAYARTLGRTGYDHVAARYSMQAMAGRLQSALKDYV